MAVVPSLTVDDWHRLNRLLEAALALGSAERAAWLDTLGDDDRHLARCWTICSRSPKARPSPMRAADRVAKLAAAALAGMRREEPGDRIGPWRLTRLIAEGGMGAVWVASGLTG